MCFAERKKNKVKQVNKKKYNKKGESLHLLFLSRCVGLPSQAWPQQFYCSLWKCFLDVHLACVFPRFSIFSSQCHLLIAEYETTLTLPLSLNIWRFSVHSYQGAVFQRNLSQCLLKASILKLTQKVTWHYAIL